MRLKNQSSSETRSRLVAALANALPAFTPIGSAAPDSPENPLFRASGEVKSTNLSPIGARNRPQTTGKERERVESQFL
jgi:hypothetical protein